MSGIGIQNFSFSVETLLVQVSLGDSKNNYLLGNRNQGQTLRLGDPLKRATMQLQLR